ncbi:MAG TPA: hypothetical protein PKN30_12785 [Flavobacteriales bacterium]|nr:hypothetical protein [Flavobacteriales bacterium]
MRYSLFILWSLAIDLYAQPDRSIILVRDSAGRSLRGTFASTIAAHAWTGTKRKPPITVEIHFTVSEDYPNGAHGIGTHQSWPLTPDTLRFHGRRHERYHVIDCWCAQKYLLARCGSETMRIDLPQEGVNGEHAGPMMILFRPGRYGLAEVVLESRGPASVCEGGVDR